MNPIARYALDHWHGRQGLAWSFWINLAGLRLLVFALQEVLKPAEGADYSEMPVLVLGLAALAHGGLFLWQVVGVLRAGEAWIRDRGSMAHVWGAQLGCLAAFWLTASYALGAWQMTVYRPPERDILAEMDREHASRYTMELSPDGASITVRGSIELGITRRLGELIAANPGTRLLVIESDGGNIYEARGVARLLRENAMASLVDRSCTSACTTAFIGGVKRSMKRDARIGFHQYRVEAGYAVIITDPAKEQDRDREVFRIASVKPWFLDRMFATEASGMWFPDPAELVDAGVIQEIID